MSAQDTKMATTPPEDAYVYEVGGKTFYLDHEAAKRAFREKRVINGRNSPEFNVMPLNA